MMPFAPSLANGVATTSGAYVGHALSTTANHIPVETTINAMPTDGSYAISAALDLESPSVNQGHGYLAMCYSYNTLESGAGDARLFSGISLMPTFHIRQAHRFQFFVE
jgi:hypothetical protein